MSSPNGTAASASSNNESKYTSKISEAVRAGNITELQRYLYGTSPDEFLKSFTNDFRTPLHDACEFGDKESKPQITMKKTKELLEPLFFKLERLYDPIDNESRQEEFYKLKHEFIDKKDKSGNTALHYAVKKGKRYAVQQLLEFGADVNITNEKREEAITVIYEKFPKLILSMLSLRNGIEHGITFREEEDDEDDGNVEVTCDFSAVIGIGNNAVDVYETQMLSNALSLEEEIQAKIVTNPIIQVFLDLKWNKMQYFIYISMIFHILWSILSCFTIWNVFMIKYTNASDDTNESNLVTREKFESLGQKDFFEDFDLITRVSSFILVGFTFIVFLKEFIEIKSTPPNPKGELNCQIICQKLMGYFELENIGQWVLIISLVVLLSNLILPYLHNQIDYTLSIAAVVISCVLMLGQLNKYPRLGLYMEMFRKCWVDFALLFLAFSPILFAFMLGFRMLMPNKSQFYFWPPWGFPKISAMFAGELNFDESHGDEVEAAYISKIVLFLAFITSVVIVLANLLIGLVVSEIQVLNDKAREKSLATQLKQMYMMEAFIIKKLNWLCKGSEEMCLVTSEVSLPGIFKGIWKGITCKSSKRPRVDVESPKESERDCLISQTQSPPARETPESGMELQQFHNRSNQNSPKVPAEEIAGNEQTSHESGSQSEGEETNPLNVDPENPPEIMPQPHHTGQNQNSSEVPSEEVAGNSQSTHKNLSQPEEKKPKHIVIRRMRDFSQETQRFLRKMKEEREKK